MTRADCKLNLVQSLNTNGFFVSSQQLYLRAALVLFCFSWNDTWLPIPTDHLMAFNCCSSPVDLVRVTWKKTWVIRCFWRCSRFAKFEFTTVTSWINCMYRQESVKKFFTIVIKEWLKQTSEKYSKDLKVMESLNGHGKATQYQMSWLESLHNNNNTGKWNKLEQISVHDYKV